MFAMLETFRLCSLCILCGKIIEFGKCVYTFKGPGCW